MVMCIDDTTYGWRMAKERMQHCVLDASPCIHTAKWCRRDSPSQPLQLLKDGDLKQHGAAAWHPFSAPLADAGIPKALLRAPMVKKLQDAGFQSLLDVRPARVCMRPRALLSGHEHAQYACPATPSPLCMCWRDGCAPRDSQGHARAAAHALVSRLFSSSRTACSSSKITAETSANGRTLSAPEPAQRRSP